jgi:hypothetical protein
MVAFGIEATQLTLEVLASSARLRISPGGEPWRQGNHGGTSGQAVGTPASLPQNQIDALEEPRLDEEPLTIAGPPASQVAAEIIRLLSATAFLHRIGL